MSPAWTASSIDRDGAGTSSYQALNRAAPALQSASVPICSSALEFTSYPPSPTQYAE